MKDSDFMPYNGRVGIVIDGIKGRICGKQFDDKAANVTCKYVCTDMLPTNTIKAANKYCKGWQFGTFNILLVENLFFLTIF